MNKDNFQKLIDAILQDGHFRFNMSCFVGKLQSSDETNKNIKNGIDLASNYGAYSTLEVQTTEMFNCDSVGCIAGFATAVANDWKTPDWLSPSEEPRESHKVIRSFVKTANEFLGLTEDQGDKLYFGNDDSVWKYLRYYESERYPKLKYSIEEYYNMEETDIFNQLEFWDSGDYEIDYLTIDYMTAADVLRRIMNDEIIICDLDEGIIINAPEDKENA